MAFLYILECADGTYYVGSTVRLEARLWQHENGMGANYTSKRLPVRLVYTEQYPQIIDAFLREKQVQGWSHAKKKALIERNDGEMHKLAECRNETHWERGPLSSAALGQRSYPCPSAAVKRQREWRRVDRWPSVAEVSGAIPARLRR